MVAVSLGRWMCPTHHPSLRAPVAFLTFLLISRRHHHPIQIHCPHRPGALPVKNETLFPFPYSETPVEVSISSSRDDWHVPQMLVMREGPRGGQRTGGGDQMGSRPGGLLYKYIHYKNDFKGVGEFYSLWESPIFLLDAQVCWKQDLGRRHGEESHMEQGSLSHSGTCGARNTVSSGSPGPLCSFIGGHLWRPVVPRITGKVTKREEKMRGRTRGLTL